jgi:hypothetical protein
MDRLNFRWPAADNAGVDQVSRPMQIALVAVVLLAGMWFTVLKPKPDSGSDFKPTATPAASSAASQPVAPGVKGLATAVDKAKGASATSDVANAGVQAATGGSAAAATSTLAPKPAAAKAAAPAAKAKAKAKAKGTTRTSAGTAKATKPVAGAKSGTKAATAKAAAPAADVDPSDRLLSYLDKGKVLVILFEGKGADDKAARKAVHQTALRDAKHVVSAYIPVADVGKYEAITSDVQVLTSPTVLVIGKDRKATALTGFFDAPVIRQAVGDARRLGVK